MCHFCPPGSGFGSAFKMRIRIQQLKLMRILADPNPQPLLIRQGRHKPWVTWRVPRTPGCTGWTSPAADRSSSSPARTWRELFQAITSVAHPGCLSRIPDPNFFHPGSRIRIKEFKYCNPKIVFLSSRKYDPGGFVHPGSGSRFFLPIPDPGVQKAPDPGYGTATLAITLAFHLNDHQIRDSRESWSFTYKL